MISTYPYSVIDNGVFEINEFDGSSMFLIAGDERALLVDAGVGIGDLKTFIGGLTDRPIDVLLTHNHRDHVGNAPRYSAVHMGKGDIGMGSILRNTTSRESRMQFAYNVCKMHPDKNYPWCADDFAEFAQEPRVIPVVEGFMFDLGGRSVQCIATPGHTPGSMSAIDSKTGILFCGDACNGVLGLGIRPIEGMQHASVEEAYDALKRLETMNFDHERIYNGHIGCRIQGQPLPKYILPCALSAMEKIISGHYRAIHKHIPSINADVEVVQENGVEIQFHKELIHRVLIPLQRRPTTLIPDVFELRQRK